MLRWRLLLAVRHLQSLTVARKSFISIAYFFV